MWKYGSAEGGDGDGAMRHNVVDVAAPDPVLVSQAAQASGLQFLSPEVEQLWREYVPVTTPRSSDDTRPRGPYRAPTGNPFAAAKERRSQSAGATQATPQSAFAK